MKIEFSNNQYKDGVFLDPEIELKTFLIECTQDEFLDLYLGQLGITSRHLVFYKCLLEFADKGGGFVLMQLKDKLQERGFKLTCSRTYISELKNLRIAGVPVVKKLNNGMWKIPKEILFRKNDLKGEFRVYVLKNKD